MFSTSELVQFLRQHRDDQVLSLYLDAEEHDPAARQAWRRRMGHVLDAAREPLSGDALQQFERARRQLENAVAAYEGFLPGTGWVGFATATSTLHTEAVAVAMPDTARWQAGPCVAPYVRAVPLAAPVVCLLLDSRRARFLRWQRGTFEELPAIFADSDRGDLSDNVNMSKRGGTTTGVRGQADHDVAERLDEVAAARVLDAAVERVQALAGSEGFAVVGGPPAVTAAALERLSGALPLRVIENATIAFHTPEAQLKEAAMHAGATLAQQQQQHLIGEIFGLTAAKGRGCTGIRATEAALAEQRVEVLLVSDRFVRADLDRAERYVTAAFDQKASVIYVGDPAATRLDSEAGGVVARLRYTR
jgi:hypothetical protein